MFHVNCTADHDAVARAFRKFKHAPVLHAEEAVFALESDHFAVARAHKETDCFAEYCDGVEYKCDDGRDPMCNATKACMMDHCLCHVNICSRGSDKRTKHKETTGRSN